MRKQFPKAQGPWWEAKAAPRAEGEPTATDLWVYDVIGDDWYDPSLTARELCQRIAAVDTDEIVLHLNSPGGSVSDGMAIYNALRTHPAKVSSIVEGWTCSIATVVALAAEDVRMFDNVMWMIHDPWSIQVGNARDMREAADYLDRVGALMEGVYQARSTKSADELRAALEAETYMTAEEAHDWGFVDEVLAGELEAAAAVDVEVLAGFGYRVPDLAGVARPAAAAGAPDLVDEVRETLARKAQETGEAGACDTPHTMDTEGLARILTAAKRH